VGYFKGKMAARIVMQHIWIKVSWPISETIKSFVNLMFRAKKSKSIKQIMKLLKSTKRKNVSEKRLIKEIKEFFLAAKKSGIVLLQDNKVGRFLKTDDLLLYTIKV